MLTKPIKLEIIQDQDIFAFTTLNSSIIRSVIEQKGSWGFDNLVSVSNNGEVGNIHIYIQIGLFEMENIIPTPLLKNSLLKLPDSDLNERLDATILLSVIIILYIYNLDNISKGTSNEKQCSGQIACSRCTGDMQPIYRNLHK